MITRTIFAFCCSAMFMGIGFQVEAFARRDVSPETSPTQFLDAFKENIDQFRQCIDQSLAKTIGEVNEKQLQPVFSVISDHLDRVSKAFDDLTAPKSAQKPSPA